MKRLIIVLCCTLIVLFSCEKNIDKCKYNILFSQIDTSLFITYKINNQEFKYYQCYSFSYGEGPGKVISEDNIDTVFYFGRSFCFCNLESPSQQPETKMQVGIWNKYLKSDFKSENVSLPALIKNEYSYTCPKQDSQINDTVYLSGVELGINNGEYSTYALMNNFFYNYDTLFNHVLKDAYFRIDKIEPLCNSFFLIQGEFETKLMNTPSYGNEATIININEGKFKFIIE